MSFKKCENIRNTLEVATRSRIHIHNLAISDFEGQIDFYPVDANLSSVPNVGASSMFQFIEGLNGTMFGQNLVQNHEIAQSTTLDLWSNTMEFKEIDIIWLDVQGAELLVFKGGIETLKKTKVILTEVGIKPYYKNHTLKPEIDTLLTEIGFEEVSEAFQFNGFDYEANTIYVNKKFKL
jgi:FkbM family methyltransferase